MHSRHTSCGAAAPDRARPLHVGIDGSILAPEPRGHAIYATNLCRQLGHALPGARFTVYSQNPTGLSGLTGDWTFRVGGGCPLPPVVWGKIVLGSLCRRDRIDLFWSPYVFLPVLPKDIGTLVTIHDFASERAPESFHPLHRMAHWLFAAGDARRADAIMAVSEGTRSLIRRHVGRGAVVVPPAVDSRFVPQSAAAIRRVCAAHDIADPYLLNVAAWEPRKNVASLVKAFLGLKRDGLLDRHILVLAGGRGRAYRDVEALAASGGDAVRVLGYVGDSDLPALYAGADAFVFPSVYEGFGMPVAEALACGTRVLAADSAELREAGGPACHYVEPTEAGIREGILHVLASRVPERGQIPGRTWAASAAILADLMVQVADNVSVAAARPPIRHSTEAFRS